MPDTNSHLLCDSTLMKCPEKAKPKTQKAGYRLSGTGRGKTRNDCLMGAECPFGVMRMFWNKMMAMVAHCQWTKSH